MSNTGASFKPEANREVAFGSITASFVQMGPVFKGFIRTIYIENTTDVILYFAITDLNGVTIQAYKVAPNSFRLYDVKTNDGYYNPGQFISVKHAGVAPGSGYANVETNYS